MTGTDKAVDRVLVMTDGEVGDSKMVLPDGEIAATIKLVDEALGGIGDTGVKDVLFRKLWWDFPW